MGLVYLPTFVVEFMVNVGKYTSPMDAMSMDFVGTPWANLDFATGIPPTGRLGKNPSFNGGGFS